MSSASLFSPNWFRVASLHPQLGVHIRVRRQQGRGATWYILTDSASGRQHRINDQAYQFAGRCNGRHSTKEIWNALLEKFGDDAPTQDEILLLIGRLTDNGILQVERPTNVEALFEHHRERSTKQRRSKLNPFYFRINLGNPESLLRHLDKLTRQIFRTWVLLPLTIVIAIALGSAIAHWSELRAHAAAYLITPRYLILMWACYPAVKLIHEIAHAMAIRRWGGEVNQMGIGLLALVPAPFVDASAASAFGPAHQRLTVSAAGILAELALASVALLVWLNVEAGLLRDGAFCVAIIGSVSTILFNGNPLLRFDGYYVLTDALNLPNLGPRSNRYWAYLTQRHLLGLDAARSPEPTRGEQLWLVLYAPLAWGYKVLACLLLTLWIASKSQFLGMATGLFLLHMAIARPMYRALDFAFFSPALEKHSLRARLISLTAASLAVIVVAATPMPTRTVAEGIVWLPERAQLRVETSGFIVKLAASDGDLVHPGQLIAVLEDAKLDARHSEQQGKLNGLRAAHYQSFLGDPLKTRNTDEAIRQVEAELARTEEQLTQLEVRAQVAGRLVLPNQEDSPGKFLKQGALLGHVFNPEEIRVRAVVEERDIALVRDHTKAVRVLIADSPEQPLEAGLTGETPAATYTLPSPALGDRTGGSHITDPADKDGIRTLAPVFLVDLTLPANATPRVGSRVWVHFEHASEPLLTSWTRRLQQMLLKHFSGAT